MWKWSQNKRGQNCFLWLFFLKTTVLFLQHWAVRQLACWEGRSPEMCHGWPSTGEVCSSSQWCCVCDSAESLLRVCTDSTAGCSEFWPRSSSHSQRHDLIWLVSGGLPGPLFTSAVSLHSCPSFQETWEKCSFLQLSYFLVRLFVLF